MKKLTTLQLKGFNRKKKKPTNNLDVDPSSFSPSRELNESPLSAIDSPLNNRSSMFRNVFSPRSFKGRGKTLQEDLPSPSMSPMSIDESNIDEKDGKDGKVDELSLSRDFDEPDSFSHNCGKSLPSISPMMAAIEARTEEMFRSLRQCKLASGEDNGGKGDHEGNGRKGDWGDREARGDRGDRTNTPNSNPSSPAGVASPTKKKSLGALLGRNSLGRSPTAASPSRANTFGNDKPERKWTMRGLTALLTRHSTMGSLGEPSTDLTSNWLIDFEDLTIGKTIGHSSFGTVCQGTFNGTNVAVKTIECDSADVLLAFQKEAEHNCKLRHPNIVLFMGICVQPTKVCLVTELMVRGNVRELLIRPDNDNTISWSLRKNWALDTARGMAYLHSLDPPIIHRDLKTTNLLVDRGMSVKICDFGLSRVRSKKVMSSVGTVQFTAPEVLRNELYNENADLFSFGTVMWELYTRSRVFDGMSKIDIYIAVMNGEMPGVDDDCDASYRDLMIKCWSMDPLSRPTFREVIERLTPIVDEDPLGAR